MSKASQERAVRLAAAIQRAEAMHGPGVFGFGELQRFHGGPDAVDAARDSRRNLAGVDSALRLYGLRVRMVTRKGITVERCGR